MKSCQPGQTQTNPIKGITRRNCAHYTGNSLALDKNRQASIRVVLCPDQSYLQKGDKSSPANYRPISLTCILCKVLEHIMASHLVRHLNKHGVLYDLQHDFREKRSCETQFTMLFEDLARNTSAGKQTDLIRLLLEFSKAFDKVHHSKLLWKLHQYGIRGTALSWIRAFLGYRSQTVVFEGEESGSVPVTSGVHQGSVLGPILFLVYINDLPEELSAKVRLFADDTAVYLSVGGLDDGTVLKQTMTDCLRGRASGTWSLTPLGARWYV